MPVSLILDALNRSRQDESPVPGLATYHPMAPVSANRWQYLLWVALSVAIVLIAWLIVERTTKPPLPVASSASVMEANGNSISASVVSDDSAAPVALPAAQPQAATANAPAVPEVNLSEEQTPTVEAGDATLELSVPTPQSADTTSPAAAQKSLTEPEPALTEPMPVPVENDAVAQLYANPDLAEEPILPASRRESDRGAHEQVSAADSASASKRTTQPVDIDRILQQAREEMENAGLTDHSVPFLAELSQQTKDSVPTIHYLRHDYSSNISASTVLLNGKTLNVGGSPAPGMKVEEILPDSVVLSYQGTQFRLRALNSWINL